MPPPLATSPAANESDLLVPPCPEFTPFLEPGTSARLTRGMVPPRSDGKCRKSGEFRRKAGGEAGGRGGEFGGKGGGGGGGGERARAEPVARRAGGAARAEPAAGEAGFTQQA